MQSGLEYVAILISVIGTLIAVFSKSEKDSSGRRHLSRYGKAALVVALTGASVTTVLTYRSHKAHDLQAQQHELVLTVAHQRFKHLAKSFLTPIKDMYMVYRPQPDYIAFIEAEKHLDLLLNQNFKHYVYRRLTGESVIPKNLELNKYGRNWHHALLAFYGEHTSKLNDLLQIYAGYLTSADLINADILREQGSRFLWGDIDQFNDRWRYFVDVRMDEYVNAADHFINAR